MIYYLTEGFSVCGYSERAHAIRWTRNYLERGRFKMVIDAADLPAAAAYVYNTFNGETARIDRCRYVRTGKGWRMATLEGSSLEAIFDGRVISPSSVRYGETLGIAKKLVELNASASANSGSIGGSYGVTGKSRAIAGLVLADNSQQPLYTGCMICQEFGGETLEEGLRTILSPFDLTYRILRAPGSAVLTFLVVRGEDRSGAGSAARVLFSEHLGECGIRENAQDFTRRYNCVIIGNSDYHSWREFPDGKPLRELFAQGPSKTSLSTVGATGNGMQYAAQQALNKANRPAAIELEIASNAYPRYRIDYDLGDLCMLHFPSRGIQGAMRLTSVEENSCSDGLLRLTFEASRV